MKQTLHKLLCALLVLTMLCSMVPAVFADDPVDPVEHTDEHQLVYTQSETEGQHHVTCSVSGCNFTPVDEPCEPGEAHWLSGTETHVTICVKCSGVVSSASCAKEYTPSTAGKHNLECPVCHHVYDEADCVDEDENGTCDLCGAAMPADEEKQIVSFAPVAGITVDFGTAQSDLPLQRVVYGYTAGQTRVECSVSWSCSNYDANKPGTYIFTGTIALPDGYTLATDVSSTVSVEVKVSGEFTIDLTSASRNVSVGSTLDIPATIKQSGKAVTDLTGLNVSWKVDETQLATISGKYGYYNRGAVGVLSADACKSVSGTNVKVTATLTRGTEVLDTADITVKIIPASASTIKVNAANGGVVFGESAFYSALGYGLGGKLGYVTFELPSSSKGVLYTDSSRYASRLTSGNKCYYNPRYTASVIDLDNVYFGVADKFTGSVVTLSYTAYNAAGYVIATGTIDVSLSTATIKYTTDAGGKVTFNEDDFRSVLRANYAGSALSYVQFDMSKAVFGNSYTGNGKYGHLYIDSTLTTKLTESNDDNAKFVYNYRSSSASRYDYDLDDVTYVAGSATGKYTVTIPFVAYGTGYEVVSGLVEIVVDETDLFTIGYTGTDFRAVTKELAETYKNAAYIMFELPEEGTLYYNYDAINSYGHKVRSSYAYYLSPGSRDEYDLDDVFFVPAAGQTKATIRFDVYSGKTKVDSGSVTFSVKGKTSSSVFTDVTYANTGSWAADAVDFMNANSLIYGTGKNHFNPTGTMTRGDLVLILYRLAGRPSVSGVKNPFADVKSSDYYYDAVLWAYANSVVNGTGRSTFSPKKNVTREQLAAILYRYSGTPTTSGRLTSFTDADNVSSYATNAMKWAVGAGIITGSGSKLNPQGSATRAQVAAMLHRYLTK
ncbi:MAG: S-layer homology domain-containing protein [Clostridiales bacterium]|nr:S-layer homology domain-containing protein [Clostridiales bacterium]